MRPLLRYQALNIQAAESSDGLGHAFRTGSQQVQSAQHGVNRPAAGKMAAWPWCSCSLTPISPAQRCVRAGAQIANSCVQPPISDMLAGANPASAMDGWAE